MLYKADTNYAHMCPIPAMFYKDVDVLCIRHLWPEQSDNDLFPVDCPSKHSILALDGSVGQQLAMRKKNCPTEDCP